MDIINLALAKSSVQGVIKGDKGDTGSKGDTGPAGNGISKVELVSTSDLNKTYRITYTNGTTFDFTVADGAKGDKGDKGDNGSNYTITQADYSAIADVALTKLPTWTGGGY